LERTIPRGALVRRECRFVLPQPPESLLRLGAGCRFGAPYLLTPQVHEGASVGKQTGIAERALRPKAGGRPGAFYLLSRPLVGWPGTPVGVTVEEPGQEAARLGSWAAGGGDLRSLMGPCL
jgi:hypothetical protein